MTYCRDGYFAIDDTSDLVNPNTAFKVKANITLDFEDTLRDIRLGSYLTLIEQTGERMSVIKRSTYEALYIDLNEGNSPSKIVAGQFTPDFVIFQIEEQGR